MDRNSMPPSPEQIKYKQEGDNEYLDNQPQLAGGSERDVREPHPVSNDKLQKVYPNIVVLHGNPAKNQVALTFDDGPDIRFTPQVLDVLAKHDVKATFFLIGARAEAHRDITKRIHDEGHAIGNHTYWHPNLPKEDLERLYWELTENERVIEDITGFKPRLFRSPYGALNEEIVKMLGEKDNMVIGWDVDSLDWKQPGADIISDNILSNVGFGSIILMHDGGDWSMDLSGTPQALDKVISKLKEDGTKFVTVPELIGIPEAK
jgi:peptidoglycan-N-acetylglucosamine deacetylase